MDIAELDIAVNAVATAVKDFFFKRLPPILDDDHMSELESISSKYPIIVYCLILFMTHGHFLFTYI